MPLEAEPIAQTGTPTETLVPESETAAAFQTDAGIPEPGIVTSLPGNQDSNESDVDNVDEDIETLEEEEDENGVDESRTTKVTGDETLPQKRTRKRKSQEDEEYVPAKRKSPNKRSRPNRTTAAKGNKKGKARREGPSATVTSIEETEDCEEQSEDVETQAAETNEAGQAGTKPKKR